MCAGLHSGHGIAILHFSVLVEFLGPAEGQFVLKDLARGKQPIRTMCRNQECLESL